MRIIWHGHACFEVRDRMTVVMDPHDGKSLGIKPPHAKADIVLVSHDHFDHNCTRVLKGDYAVVREPGRSEVKGVKILGVEAAHDEQGGGKRGKVTMFKFDLGGVQFCHCGDLGQELTPKQVEALGRVDVLFIPVGNVFTINASQAQRLVKVLGPAVAVPMHYRYGGLSLSIQPVEPFLEGMPKDSIVRVGNEVEFTKDDLPEKTEIWVFSP
jgi:L-ascorbate metabolism protein UlaG (beta-lactamase superfamily)